MKIYIDILVLQDAIMMSLILIGLQKIMKLKITIVRILTISFVSSCASTFILIVFPTWWDNLLIKALLSYGIVKYGLPYKETISVVQKVILFWTMCFLMGGVSLFANSNVALSFIVMLIIIMTITVLIQTKKKLLLLEDAVATLIFQNGNQKFVLRALVDTGHDVKTKYDEDVIFVKPEFIKEGNGKEYRKVSFQTIAGKEQKKGMVIKQLKIQYHQKKMCRNVVMISTPNIPKQYDAIIGYTLIE